MEGTLLVVETLVEEEAVEVSWLYQQRRLWWQWTRIEKLNATGGGYDGYIMDNTLVEVSVVVIITIMILVITVDHSNQIMVP